MDAELMKEIGKRIAELRRSHKITQETLAELLDVSSKHISHVERGCASLSLHGLIELCNLFHCSLDYLVLGRETDPSLNRLPAPILDILHSNNEEEIVRLCRYLQIYPELIENK